MNMMMNGDKEIDLSAKKIISLNMSNSFKNSFNSVVNVTHAEYVNISEIGVESIDVLFDVSLKNKKDKEY
jgi:hypothetical protein